ncbi:hypothetical protein GCM10009759_52370 [Kitasatospora saccharophila]|uniref:Uncharacterized protein n=1 Tax=Kitasatospora saccharophila TaxID=407973 RepID=A0ABN2XHF0_9ACTN
MFENVQGIPAEKAERLGRLVEECRPVLAGPGASGPISLHQALDLARAARS